MCMPPSGGAPAPRGPPPGPGRVKTTTNNDNNDNDDNDYDDNRGVPHGPPCASRAAATLFDVTLVEVLQPRENMVEANMILEEYNQIQTWLS